jgi:P4 family phage/plasmid primase-like protien
MSTRVNNKSSTDKSAKINSVKKSSTNISGQSFKPVLRKPITDKQLYSIISNQTFGMMSEALSFHFKPIMFKCDIKTGNGKHWFASTKEETIQISKFAIEGKIKHDEEGNFITDDKGYPIITGYEWNCYNEKYNSFYYKSANVGLECGKPNNIIVIDVDLQDNGIENFTSWIVKLHYIDDNGKLVNYKSLDDFNEKWEGPIVKTPSGGYHYYFNYKDEYFGKINSKPDSGIDCQSNGKNIVYPGSTYMSCKHLKKEDDEDGKQIHKCGCKSNKIKDCLFRGRKYEWLKSPKDYPIPDVPTAFLQYIIKPETENKIEVNYEVSNLDNEVITKICTILQPLSGECMKTWMHIICILKNIGASLEQVLLFSSGIQEKYDENATIKLYNTIQPNKYNLNQLKYYIRWALSISSENPEEMYEQICSELFEKELYKLILNGDIGLGKLFYLLNKDKYVVTDLKNEKGYTWNKTTKLWNEIESCDFYRSIGESISTFIKKVITQLEKENNELMNKFEEECKLDKNDTKILKQFEKEKKKFIKEKLNNIDLFISKKDYSLGVTGMKKIFAIAKTHLYDSTFISKLNNSSFELPIKNGLVLNLKDGSTKERTIKDIWDYECPVNYLKDNSTSNAIKYLSSVCCEPKTLESDGEEEYNEYLKDVKEFGELPYTMRLARLLGYFLSKEISDRKMYVAYGVGKNSKTTLFDKIMKTILCSQKGCTIADDTLLLKNKTNSATAPEILAIREARLIICSEPDKQDKIDSKNVKRLTGGDELTARGLFKEKYESFTCYSKIVILCNKKIEFDASDPAMVDRIQLLPFLARFENSSENRRFVDDISTKYLDEFFTLIVNEGMKYWKTMDLTFPSICRINQNYYIEDNDPFQSFINERCTIGVDLTCKFNNLFTSYNLWLQMKDLKKETKQTFSSLLESKSFKRIRTNTSNFWKGIKLNDEEEVNGIL